MELRPYQTDTIDAVFAAWDSGMRSPAIVIPTGGGKTVVFSHIIKRYMQENPGKRVLVLAHRAELLQQASDKIQHAIPGMMPGIVAANRDDTFSRIVVGSVQTLRNYRRRAALGKVGLIVTDEAHHATANSYRAIYDHFPDALMLGVTATMVRSDRSSLGDVWEEIVFEYPIMSLIRDGYLADVKGVRVEVPDLDLSKVKKTAGDYQAADLGRALEASLAPELVAEAVVTHCGDSTGILFAPTVQSAYVFAESLRERGITCDVLHGKTPNRERTNMLSALNYGTLQFIVNCMVLTEGFDSPKVRNIVLARATKSPSLGIQMAGRGMRPHPDKDYCLILDVSGSTEEIGLLSVSDLVGRPVRDGATALESELEDYVPEPVSRRDKPIHFGEVEHREFDPFAAARRVWRKSNGGFWFIPDEDRFVFIMPGAEVGTYDVAWRATRGPIKGRSGDVVGRGLPDLSVATERAEQVSSGRPNFGSGRGRPSAAVIRYAKSLGIEVASTDRSGDVSVKIDLAVAINVIDRPVLAWLEQEGRVMYGGIPDADNRPALCLD
jgi:superfamily II DNA or RNA helicase